MSDSDLPVSDLVLDGAELKAAMKRARDAEEERDILKKALAIFSKPVGGPALDGGAQ